MRRFLAALSAVLTVASCSDDESGGPPPGGASSDPPAGTCRYIADAAAAAILNESRLTVTGGESGCTFRPADGAGLGMQLNATRIQIDPDDYVRQSLEACDQKLGSVDVPGVDDAWLCKDIEIQGYAVKGSLLVSVGASSLFSEPDATEQQQVTVARDTLFKLRFP